MTLEPAFYLISTDTYPPIEPRKCFIEARFEAERGGGYLLVKLDPPIRRYPHWGPLALGLEEAVLAARLGGDTLNPINVWPMHVYICRVNEQIRSSRKLSPKDLEAIYWGELCPTLADAEKEAQRFR